MALSLSPSVDALLEDSLIRSVMRADGVEPQALKAMLAGVACRIAARRGGGPGLTRFIFARPPIGRRATSHPSAATPRTVWRAPAHGPCGSARRG